MSACKGRTCRPRRGASAVMGSGVHPSRALPAPRGVPHRSRKMSGSFLQVCRRLSMSATGKNVLQKTPAVGADALRRGLHTTSTRASGARTLNKPTGGNQLVRSGGIASFMRLPVQVDTEGLDACFVGVPMDIGASNRSGTRLGPRQIRCESVLLRPHNQATGANPFNYLNVADVGDVNFNTFNLPEACKDIRDGYMKLVSGGCIPLTMGGDHTITYPILQAIKAKHGPVGLIHVDAHADVSDTMLGAKITHGTPFRRALEEDLIDPHSTFQIGLRGSAHESNPHAWQIEKGFTIYSAEDCWYKSLSPLMEKIRQQLGNKPVYLSFDIDGIDPAFCPGTGTPEIGGLTTIQGLEIIRGCRGLNLVGCDLVEVSPPYDFEGTTALTGANLLFEMLCVLPGNEFPEK